MDTALCQMARNNLHHAVENAVTVEASRRTEDLKAEADQMRAQSIKFDAERQRAEKERDTALREGEMWKRLHDEQVKAQTELADWVQANATSGYGQLHSTVALRMLKEDAEYIKRLKAQNHERQERDARMLKEQAEEISAIKSLRKGECDTIERQREQIARLNMKIGHLEASSGSQDKLAFPTFPAGRIPASPALRAAMGAALESGRSCSVCAKQGPHVAHMILDALTAYDTAKADEANAQASKRQGGLCL